MLSERQYKKLDEVKEDVKARISTINRQIAELEGEISRLQASKAALGEELSLFDVSELRTLTDQYERSRPQVRRP